MLWRVALASGVALGASAGFPYGCYTPVLRAAGVVDTPHAVAGASIGITGFRPVHEATAALLAVPASALRSSASMGGSSTLAHPPSSNDPSLWDTIFLACLSDYPAHGGWDVRCKEAVTLTQLLDTGLLASAYAVSAAAKEGAVEGTPVARLALALTSRLPMLLDLGSTLMAPR